MDELDIDAWLEQVSKKLNEPQPTAEERYAEMKKHWDDDLRDRIERTPLTTMPWRDLENMPIHHCHKSDYQISIMAQVQAEMAARIEAGKNGPVFKKGDYVEVCGDIQPFNKAGAAKPSIGMRARVVAMLDYSADPSRTGLVHVRIKPSLLGYSGREHVSYVIPNVFLKAVE